MMFPLAAVSKIGNQSLKIRGGPIRIEMRRTFFTHKVMNLWYSMCKLAIATKYVQERSMDIKGIHDMGWWEEVKLSKRSAIILLNTRAWTMKGVVQERWRDAISCFSCTRRCRICSHCPLNTGWS